MTNRLSEEAMKEIGKFEQLTTLHLYGKIPNKGFSELSGCKKLNHLLIPPNFVNDDMLRDLKKLGLLHAMNQFSTGTNTRPNNDDEVHTAQLIGTTVTPAGLKELAVFKNLNMIQLMPHQINLQAIKELNSIGLLHALPQAGGLGGRPKSKDEVRGLALNGVPQAIECLMEFSECKNLENLTISVDRFDEKLLGIMRKFPKLKNLSVVCQTIDPGMTTRLTDFHDLQSVSLSANAITDQVFADLIKAKLICKCTIAIGKNGGRPAAIEDIVSLQLAGSQVTDDSIKQLAGFKNLASLSLDNSPAIHGREFKTLAGLKELTNLSMGGNCGVDAEGLKELQKLAKLQSLNMAGLPSLQNEEGRKQAEELKQKLTGCKIVDTLPPPVDNGGGD